MTINDGLGIIKGMLFSVLSAFLVSTSTLPVPDIYLGSGWGLFPQAKYSRDETNALVRRKLRDQYFSFGLPMKMSYWVFTPEFSWSDSIFQFNILFGPSGEISLGHRQKLASLDWVLQGGFHYNQLVASDPLNADGTEVSKSDKSTIAFMFSPQIGPKYVFSEDFSLALFLNPRITFGSIGAQTYAWNRYPSTGWLFNINLQLNWSSWMGRKIRNPQDK